MSFPTQKKGAGLHRVATPQGAGMFLDVDGNKGQALVGIEGQAVSFPAEQVGLW